MRREDDELLLEKEKAAGSLSMLVNYKVNRRLNRHKIHFKNLGKKLTMKLRWKRMRRKLMKGVHKYHNSLEGKLHHRRLNRFNKLRNQFGSLGD